MTDTRGKAASRGKAAAREKVDAESVLINGQIVMAMAAGTAFAVLMLVSGALYRTDWLIMLAVCAVLSALARSYLMLPARKAKNSRSRMIKGYAKYKMSGMILAVSFLIMLLFTVIKHREGFFYPLPAIIFAAIYALFKIGALVMDLRVFGEVDGPYAAGLKLMDLGGALLAVLLVVHLVAAIVDGTFVAAGILWIVTAVVFALLLAASVYMIVFADSEIRYFSEG
ncbi:MAG: hypothetical protein J6D53_12360 [Blautia sp.]|nr:hypothetical protein [Blautia sp.]